MSARTIAAEFIVTAGDVSQLPSVADVVELALIGRQEQLGQRRRRWSTDR